MLMTSNDPKKIGNGLCNNLESCNKWLIESKLLLHMGKTKNQTDAFLDRNVY